MSRFRLQSSKHSVELAVGEFVIGRDPTCSLVVDDAAVSRRHAILHVEAQRVVLEDLGSSNGVMVGGIRLKSARREIAPGTRFAIGTQDFALVATQSSVPARKVTADDADETLGPAQQDDGLQDVSVALFERALAAGDVQRAGQNLKAFLARRLRAYRAGEGIGTLAHATDCALRMAAASGEPGWVEWMFLAHGAARVAMPVDTVNALYSIMRKVRTPPVAIMRQYVDGLRARLDTLGPSERFAAQRLDGLLRVALAG